MIKLTPEEFAQACRNIGADPATVRNPSLPACGACAEVFYTGMTIHTHTCLRGGSFHASRPIEIR